MDENEVAVDALEMEAWSVPRLSGRALALFLVVTTFVGADILHDSSMGAELEHLVMEGALMIVAVGGVWVFWRVWQGERLRARASLALSEQRARSWEAAATTWRIEAKEATAGLSALIDRQFARWQLTPAEAEVALLLLKGLSHKEVATVRETSERTTRKQARAVYRKGDIAGRAELSAFFLEDLLAPRE